MVLGTAAVGLLGLGAAAGQIDKWGVALLAAGALGCGAVSFTPRQMARWLYAAPFAALGGLVCLCLAWFCVPTR